MNACCVNTIDRSDNGKGNTHFDNMVEIKNQFYI